MLTLRQYELTRDYLLWVKHRTREALINAENLELQKMTRLQIENEQRRRIKEITALEMALSIEIDLLRADKNKRKGDAKCPRNMGDHDKQTASAQRVKQNARSTARKSKTPGDGTFTPSSSGKNGNERKKNDSSGQRHRKTNE